MVGECTGGYVPQLMELGWARMWIARGRNPYQYVRDDGYVEPIGVDNGAFRDYLAGLSFDGDAFMRTLDKVSMLPHPPYLAVLPDIVGGGLASLELSLEWLGRDLPDFPWYLAVQDGMVPDDVDPSLFSGIFLGGTNSYKATARQWCEFAHAHNIPAHFGRCGTQAKIALALEVGFDSLDSAVAMWTKARWRLFRESLTNGPPQQDMFYRGLSRCEAGQAMTTETTTGAA
jgi:hypothetical protein